MKRTAKKDSCYLKESLNSVRKMMADCLLPKHSVAIEEEEYMAKTLFAPSKEWLNHYFPIVHGAGLSLNDEYLAYEPKTDRQKMIKEIIIEGIYSGQFYNFRAQAMDPFLQVDDTIYYIEDQRPVTGKDFNWLEQKAYEFLPEKESRLGNLEERIAFLAYLLKLLVEQGTSKEEAWAMVCDDSEKLGNFKVISKEKISQALEVTGNRLVAGKFYDLGNTFKVLANNADFGTIIAGGTYANKGSDRPVSFIKKMDHSALELSGATPWVVMNV